MKTETSKVRHKGEVVSEIEIPIYENLDELMAAVAGDVIVEKFNKANKIDLQATARAPFSEKKTAKARREAIGFDLLTTDEIFKFAGNHAGLKEYLDSPEMADKIDAKNAEMSPVAGGIDAAEPDVKEPAEE